MNLKRFAWLLAIPYVVQVTTGTLPYCEKLHSAQYYKGCEMEDIGLRKVWIRLPNGDMWTNYCVGSDIDCVWVYDQAESLNTAHERRTQPKNKDEEICVDGHCWDTYPVHRGSANYFDPSPVNNPSTRLNLPVKNNPGDPDLPMALPEWKSPSVATDCWEKCTDKPEQGK